MSDLAEEIYAATGLTLAGPAVAGIAKILEARDARITELEAALATARREGMEDAAKIAENEPELSGPMPAEFEKYSRETLARASCIATKREIAAAIRAAVGEGKP